MSIKSLLRSAFFYYNKISYKSVKKLRIKKLFFIIKEIFYYLIQFMLFR